MTSLPRVYVVSLLIPDNEAYTALNTLVRLRVPVSSILRSDVWLASVDAAHIDAVDAVISTIETIFNPNKHRLEIRAGDRPASGEVWITARDETPATTMAGRLIPGIEAIARRTAWRLLDEHGADVPASVLDRATETFLCNPAFQKAIR